MKLLKRGIIQAAAIAVIAFPVAFIFNAWSANGVNPFRRIDDVPVIDQFQDDESEGIIIIDLERFRELINAGKVVIDARTESEYLEGHIPGAKLLDYYQFGSFIDDVIPYISFDEELAIYCTGPFCEDSELLARELFALGYRKILVFRDGIEGWEEAGLPLEIENK